MNSLHEGGRRSVDSGVRLTPQGAEAFREPSFHTAPLQEELHQTSTPEESAAVIEAHERKLCDRLHTLIKLPYTEWGRFSTVDFLEDVVAVLNRYDPAFVKRVVQDFVKRPAYNVRACEALLDLANLSPAERDQFLADRRAGLRLGNVSSG